MPVTQLTHMDESRGRNSEVIQPGPPDFPVKGPKYPEAGHKFLGSVRGSEA